MTSSQEFSFLQPALQSAHLFLYIMDQPQLQSSNSNQPPNAAAPSVAKPPAKPEPAWFKLSLAAGGGFLVAFLGVSAATLTQQSSMQFQGQLVSGGVSPGLPTTLNTMQHLGTNPLVTSMGSYMWWTVVVVLAIPCAWLVFGMIRRYA